MAHYAFLNPDNVVVMVIVGIGENETVNGVSDWEQFYSTQNGCPVVRTSYNTYGGVHYTTDDEGNRVPSEDQSKAFRKNYAGIGYTYDEDLDAFIPPKPEGEWVLDEGTCLWVEVTDV